MGSSCINLSLANIWKSWFKFKKDKRKTKELDNFSYYLEQNLQILHRDLNSGKYRHGGYQTFVVYENKRREIRVTSIRDRIVHRLLYEYLYGIYDKTFIYDVWSCRKEKGLLGAIERTQKFLKLHKNSFVWRADITKFFDNVNQSVLLKIFPLKIKDPNAIKLLTEIIGSFAMPIRERVKAPTASVCP